MIVIAAAAEAEAEAAAEAAAVDSSRGLVPRAQGAVDFQEQSTK